MNSNSSLCQTRKKLACLSCRRSHTKCDGSRPCKRCVSLGKQQTCQDPPSKALLRELTAYRPSFSSPQQAKTAWWCLQGDTLILLSCTPSFAEFIQHPIEQIVQTMKIHELFPPSVHEMLWNVIQKTLISSRVEIVELQILTRLSVTKPVNCWLYALNQVSTQQTSSSGEPGSKILELTLFDLNPTCSATNSSLESCLSESNVSFKANLNILAQASSSQEQLNSTRLFKGCPLLTNPLSSRSFQTGTGVRMSVTSLLN